MNILEACGDKHLFAQWFRNPETYEAWFAFLAALFGLPMTEAQRDIYRQHTGRSVVPTAPQEEAWLVIGRRGGKSFVMALIAVYLACFRDYRQWLAPGERATIMVIATDRKQSRVIIRYIRAMLTEIPLLKQLIERETADSFDLSNSVTIEVGTASFRTTRGYTFAAVLCDEIAFWRTDEAAEPDYAILDAIRPGMATIPGSMLLCASSPYARRGALWDAYRRYYGKEGVPLLWQAETRAMNPTVPQDLIARAMERDPASAAAEYGAQFRTDIEAFITIEAVQACIETGIRERPPVRQNDYTGFVDPSGGSRDAFTLAIAHIEGGENKTAILDLVRECRPPLSPEAIVEEFAETLHRYRITKVHGDRYAGEWPREQFRKHGINYEPTNDSKSDLYQALLPIINSRMADLLDNGRLVAQLVGLERRTARGGKDSIDHPPGGHDDIANAVAGALIHTGRRLPRSRRTSPPRAILAYQHAKELTRRQTGRRTNHGY